ncbi:hypothetical protein D0Z07_4091 [Hyphodiscus hymeniophilus]|uniref:Amino acid transporter transmembrane domain-containing protein n=1 Tax=Hyphodiscus hymeniophilus TaxID=353542 RepID=A0A9P6VKG9_9HELO|nr:hypothetical protein D0Z07_4091 [Hyphodiscus hymeniophilus]
MTSNMANLALDGGDPRMEKNPGQYALDHGHDESPVNGFSIEKAHVHNDPAVLFEEYLHYASITRAEERAYEGNQINRKDPWSLGGIIKNRFSKGHVHEVNATVDDGRMVTTHDSVETVTDLEWRKASRALRTASWSSIFFLITTDILGPQGAAWAFSNTGYGPGVALYTVFGLMASISGWYVWGVYMHTDSDRYPLRDFGQAFFRVYGQKMRHLINVLQSLQMLMLVAVLVLSNGGSISQVSIGKDGKNGNGLCFIVCLLIFALLGMVLGQIRTLQRFGWLANLSVWLTVTVAFIAIGVSVNSAPNYAASFASYGGAGLPFGDTNFPGGNATSHIGVKTFGGTPPAGFASGGTGFLGTYQGLNSIIYAYGGAMLFFNLLAEMRNPWDFWKGMLCADIFIYVVYMFFGIFQYSFQGQFTISVSYQSITPFNYQTAGNIMSIAGGLIAAALYGNIGIKVIYNNVFMELFGFPSLTTKSGKIIWCAMVPIYWALAFVIAAAVPNFGDFQSLVGAFCIGNFTYAFPALLKIGFDIKKGAMLPEESFDEVTKKYTRHDDGMKRWIRGYKKTWMLTSFNIFYFLGALVVCGMGMYAAIKALMSAFGAGGTTATAFGCTSPFA